VLKFGKPIFTTLNPGPIWVRQMPKSLWVWQRNYWRSPGTGLRGGKDSPKWHWPIPE
jgi:hypothetical protein